MNRFIWLWDNAATLAGIATLLALLTALTIWTRLLRHRAKPLVVTAAHFRPSLLPGDWTTFLRIKNRSDRPMVIQRIDILGPQIHYLRCVAGELIEGRNVQPVLAAFSHDSATLAPGGTFSTSNHDLDHDAANELFSSQNRLGVITDRGDYCLALPHLRVNRLHTGDPDFELATDSRWVHAWNRLRVMIAGLVSNRSIRRHILGIRDERAGS